MGLRPRLALLLLGPTIATLAGYAYLQVDEERAERLAEFARHTAVTSTALRLAVEHELRAGSTAGVRRLMSELVTRHSEIVRMRLFDASLDVVQDATLVEDDVGGAPREQLRRVIESGAPEQTDHRQEGRLLQADLLPLHPTGATVQGVLEIVYVAGRLDEDLRSLNRRLGLQTGLLCVSLVLMMWVVLQRSVIRPLEVLTEGIERLGRGELGQPVPVARRDELGRVAEAFNEMSQRLRTETDRSLELQHQLRRTEALGRLGKFCSAVAHEVGTPLNVITGGRRPRCRPCGPAIPSVPSSRESSPRAIASRS